MSARGGMNKRAAIALAVAALAGCELIVPSALPTYACSPSDGACPSGMTCDVASGTCVSGGAGDDAPSDDGGDDGAGGDARPDADSGPSLVALGGACRLDTDCTSKLCGTSTILTTSITTGTGPICTQTCCTSADCPSAFVCFNGGTGGGYCVPAVKAQRSPPATGGALAGATCVGNGDCRSGLCSNTKCIDTCCTKSDCASGTTCGVGTVTQPSPMHDEWICIPLQPPLKNDGTTCGDNTQCKNNNCVGFPSVCTPPCCKNTDCSAWATAVGAPSGVCAYGLDGADQLKWCFQFVGTRLPVDSSCTANPDCQSSYCDPEQKKCLEVCCRDEDCGVGYICKPSATNTPFLRCVKVTR